MRTSPSIVPMDDDHDVYLVLDDFGGGFGMAWRETDPGDANFEAVIRDLLDGQYANPVRIVAFNTTRGWSRDVSRASPRNFAPAATARGERSRSASGTLSIGSMAAGG